MNRTKQAAKKLAPKKTQQVKKVQKRAKATVKKVAPKAAPLLQSKRFNSAAPASVHFAQQGPEYALSPKESTLISGLDAVPNGRAVLESLYLHTIDLSRDYSRKTGKFLYQSVENVTTYRLNVLRKYPSDDLMVERVIGAGQIEELIEQAEHELTLLDTLNRRKPVAISDDILKASAPAFGSLNPLVETRVFPLPDEVVQEIATQKFTINPYHPTKKLSRKLLQHLGLGSSITPEQHAEYDALLTLTDEEKAIQAKNLSVDVNKMVVQDVQASLLINKAEPLAQAYFDFFNTSTVVHPELDTKHVEEFTEAYEQHIRKL